MRRLPAATLALSLSQLLATGCMRLHQSDMPAQLDSESIAGLADSVFEVVIPKHDEPQITYAGNRQLPTAELPYQERNDKYFSVGTAFAIGDGRFASAAHVFQLDVYTTDDDYFVRDKRGEVHAVAKVERYSQYRDLVVFTLASEPTGVKPLALAPTTHVGERVYTVGNANGEGIAVRDGEIASYTFEPVAGAWKDLRYSAPASPGNSGGPLLDTRGAVVGVVVRKNENENLNVATPIGELDHLGADQAEFFVASAEVNADGEPVKDWRFATPLPATLAALGKAAEADRRQFHMAQWRAAMREARATTFPFDPALAEYATDQSYSHLAQNLAYDGKEGYRLTPEEPLFERPTARGEVVSGMVNNPDYALAFVELPVNTRLDTYLAKPEMLLEAILDAYGLTRDFNGRKLPLKSLGAPLSTGRFTDALGRPWLKATWRTWFNEGSWLLSCLPAPSGFGCSLDNVPTSEETFGLQEKFEEYYAGLIGMSYRGTMTEWRRYLALGGQYVPKALGGLKVAGGRGRVGFTGGAFHLDYPQPLASDDTLIFVGVGYGLNQLTVPEIQSLRFDHGPDLEASEQFDLFVETAQPRSVGRGAKASSGLPPPSPGAVQRVLDRRPLAGDRRLVQTVECRGPGRHPGKAAVATCDTIARMVGQHR